MIKELFSENVVDITMFLKEKHIGENSDYIMNLDYVVEQFNARAIRKAFFDDELVAYAEVDEEEEIKELILIDIKGEADFNFCNISVCGLKSTELLRFALEHIWEKREGLIKAKFILTEENLKQGMSVLLQKTGFEREVCLRKFKEEDQNIYTYSYFKKDEIA